jgi:hypothetical protein
MRSASATINTLQAGERVEMMDSLQRELVALIDEVAPPLIDLEQLERLVTQDELMEAYDGECLLHDGCRPILSRRIA